MQTPEELVAAELSAEEVAVVEAGGPTALAIGARLLAPRALPIVGRVLRPLAKGVVKAGLLLYDESSAAVSKTYAKVSQATGELVAEARAEREQEKSARARKTNGAPRETHRR